MVLKPRNPFSTAATSSGKIQFRHPDAGGWASILKELSANKWLGEVIGPHGTGKTTFLFQLWSILNAMEVKVNFTRLCVGGNGKILKKQLTQKEGLVAESSILSLASFDIHDVSATRLGVPKRCRIIDGFEQMAWIQQKAAIWKSRLAGDGLIVSAHCTRGLPRILQTKSSLPLLEGIANGLLEGDSENLIDDKDIKAAWEKSRGNTREALFSLYDVWEKRSSTAAQ